MSGSGSFTRWAVIASGEGGGRIASQLFERTNNPGIEDRILLMNTNRADIRNNINRIAHSAAVDTERIERKHTMVFGPKDGAGNKFHWGEEGIRQDEERVIDQIEAAEIDDADAFLYLTTLGGGTGCGSVPYLINSLQKNPPTGALADTTHVALVAWPFGYEGAQMHFNSVAGIARLMNWYDGAQNADITIVADNTHIAENVADNLLSDRSGVGGASIGTQRQNGGGIGDKDALNQALIEVIDMMIAAGRETYSTTDVIDIMAWPSQRDNRHLMPGLALDMETIYDLEMPFDIAAENTFASVDPTTSEGVIVVVRAPRSEIGRQDRFTEPGIMKALDEWLAKNGFDRDRTMKMHTLTPSDEKTDTYDVMLLFTGFNLEPLLERSMPKFDALLEGSRDGQFMEKFDDPIKDYTRRDFRQLKRNLENYIAQ